MEWILGIIGVGIVVGAAAWFWKDKNADKAVEVVDIGYEAASQTLQKAKEKADELEAAAKEAVKKSRKKKG
jgi:hypothetical protein